MKDKYFLSILVAFLLLSPILHAENYSTVPRDFRFDRDLGFGFRGQDVMNLQCIVGIEQPTGYFGSLTKKAVIDLQNAHRDEVLTLLGLSSGTGFVGPSTRDYLNKKLSEQSATSSPNCPTYTATEPNPLPSPAPNPNPTPQPIPTPNPQPNPGATPSQQNANQQNPSSILPLIPLLLTSGNTSFGSSYGGLTPLGNSLNSYNNPFTPGTADLSAGFNQLPSGYVAGRGACDLSSPLSVNLSLTPVGQKEITYFGPLEPNDQENGLSGDSQTQRGQTASGMPLIYSPSPGIVGSAASAGRNPEFPFGTVLAIRSPNDNLYHAYVVVDGNAAGATLLIDGEQTFVDNINPGSVDINYPFPVNTQIASIYYANSRYYPTYLNNPNYENAVKLWNNLPSNRGNVILLARAGSIPKQLIFNADIYCLQLGRLNNELRVGT